MGVKGIYLSWIVVSDLKKARKFFKDILGFKEHSYNEEHKWAEYEGKEGGSMIGVAETDPQMDVKPGSNAIITFTVDDIAKSQKELISKGIKMVGEIIEISGHVKMQTFADEDGNQFQIVEVMK